VKVSKKDHETGRSWCPYCRLPLDLATGVDTDDRPSEGAVGICASCGEVHVFAADLSRRRPTAEEQREIDANATIQECRRAIKRSLS